MVWTVLLHLFTRPHPRCDASHHRGFLTHAESFLQINPKIRRAKRQRIQVSDGFFLAAIPN